MEGKTPVNAYVLTGREKEEPVSHTLKLGRTLVKSIKCYTNMIEESLQN